MKKFLRTYMPFTKSRILEIFEYRMNAILWFVAEGLFMLVYFYLWKAIYETPENPVMIKGFSMGDMLIYIILTHIIGFIIHDETSYEIGGDVKEGKIATFLIKPINYRVTLLFRSLGGFLGTMFVLLIPNVLILVIMNYAYDLGFTFSFVNLLVALGVLMVSKVTMFLYKVMIGLFSFKLTEIYGLIWLTDSITFFLTGSLIPLALFPDFLMEIVTYLPFAGLVYAPAMVILGKFTFDQVMMTLAVQVAWMIVFYVVVELIWRRMIKRLVILGG